jgi:hypothetical protein
VRLSPLRAGRPPFTPRKIPVTRFCQKLSRPQSYITAGWIRSIAKSNDLIGYPTRDLPACSIVPQPTTLPRAPPPPLCRYYNQKCPGLSPFITQTCYKHEVLLWPLFTVSSFSNHAAETSFVSITRCDRRNFRALMSPLEGASSTVDNDRGEQSSNLPFLFSGPVGIRDHIFIRSNTIYVF